MGRKQKQWAVRARRKLMSFLGDRCAICFTDQNLTFDCIIPTGDRHGKKDTSARMSFYHFQFYSDNLQILCEDCHHRKNTREQVNPWPFTLIPNITILHPNGLMTQQYSDGHSITT